MGMTELGACEWFIWDLHRSKLFEREQLDESIADFLARHPRAEPAALAEQLIRKGILAPFQAERLLQGKTDGLVLGPYTLVEALGSGSMGSVYKARSKTDSQWYVLKVLPQRSLWNVAVARRKIRMFEECQHTSVVPVVDVGTSGGSHYLSRRFVDGDTLDKMVAREGRLSAPFTTMLALRTAEALDICHQRGLYHGLLKPSKVMIGPPEAGSAAPPVFVLDFGMGMFLAELEGDSFVDTMSTANAISSGLDCVSPESLVDPKFLSAISDQYSLGCLLYYCLAGRYPFVEETAAAKIMAVQVKQPPPLSELVGDLPKALGGVVERLMQKEPADRYPNTAEVVAALQAVADTLPPASEDGRHAALRIAAPQRGRFRADGARTPQVQETGRPSDGGTHRHSPSGPGGQVGNTLPVTSSDGRSAAVSVPPEERNEEQASLGAVGIIIVAAVACLFALLVLW
jgi:serine/threonine protein kinase